MHVRVEHIKSNIGYKIAKVLVWICLTRRRSGMCACVCVCSGFSCVVVGVVDILTDGTATAQSNGQRIESRRCRCLPIPFLSQTSAQQHAAECVVFAVLT